MLKGYGWHSFVLMAMPVITLVALTWERLSAAHQHSPMAVWLASALLLLVAPSVLSRSLSSIKTGGSPVLESSLALAAVLFCVGVFGFGLPTWPELFNSDLEVAGVTYLMSATAFSFAAFRWLQARRHGVRDLGSSLVVAMVTGCVALSISGAILFFE
jgi:hypothetical protein